MKPALANDITLRLWNFVKFLGLTFLLGIVLGTGWRVFQFAWSLTQ